ncbi:MAG: hypothetical protein D6696_04140 [Acidobacteria bacterium]|nr:MAG: hypothetical protein D6696_04140 [Acidobacteriota bacterium]
MIRRQRAVQATFLFILLLPAAAGLFAQQAPASFSRAVRPLDEVDAFSLPALDNRRLIAKAEEAEKGVFGAPYRFAATRPLHLTADAAGTWEDLDDGGRLWRLRLRSPGALSLSLHLSRVELPPGAALWLYNRAADHLQGPYGAGRVNRRGELWTALVYGEEAVLELYLPPAAGEPALEVAALHHGFRGVPRKLHGSCNNDVVCPEGDPWRDQIRGVVMLIYQGVIACTGQLVNNTALDQRPYVLSAFHCITDFLGGTPNFDLIPSAVAYFNFQAPVCGQQGGGSLSQNVSGASFVAGEAATDFLLIELDQPPAADFNAYFVGWNAGGADPSAAVCIHHPQGDVKSISFDDDPLTTDTEFFPNGTHWRVGGWDDGTTEGGSSGSCIFDPADGLCVGVLTGGFAACPEANPSRPEDFYGKLSAAWNAGPDAQSQLGPWLDPLGLGATTLEGMEASGGPPAGCQPSDTVLCLAGGRFQVEAEYHTPDGGGPARVAKADAISGNFYFFRPQNWELLVKVLDNCNGPTGKYWVYAAGATTLGCTLTVTDTVSGETRVYDKPFGTPAMAVADTGAFDVCPAPATGAGD